MNNKKKINKCDYGYLEHKLKVEIIKCICLFVWPIALIIIGYVIKGTKMNIFTLVAVLGLLPAANCLVTLVMYIKAQKWICDKSNYDIISNAVNLDKLNVRFDLFMTGYSKSFPVQSVTCVANSLFGYSSMKDFPEDKFEEHLKPLLSQNGLKVGNIKIFNSIDKYETRLQSINEDSQDEHDLKVLKLMENISL